MLSTLERDAAATLSETLTELSTTQYVKLQQLCRKWSQTDKKPEKSVAAKFLSIYDLSNQLQVSLLFFYIMY